MCPSQGEGGISLSVGLPDVSEFFFQGLLGSFFVTLNVAALSALHHNNFHYLFPPANCSSCSV